MPGHHDGVLKISGGDLRFVLGAQPAIAEDDEAGARVILAEQGCGLDQQIEAFLWAEAADPGDVELARRREELVQAAAVAGVRLIEARRVDGIVDHVQPIIAHEPAHLVGLAAGHTDDRAHARERYTVERFVDDDSQRLLRPTAGHAHDGRGAALGGHPAQDVRFVSVRDEDVGVAGPQELFELRDRGDHVREVVAQLDRRETRALCFVEKWPRAAALRERHVRRLEVGTQMLPQPDHLALRSAEERRPRQVKQSNQVRVMLAAHPCFR